MTSDTEAQGRQPGDGADAALSRRRDVVVAGHRGDTARARIGLADPDPGVRAAAVGALERAGALATDELRAGLADPDPVVRRRSALAAGRRDDVDTELADLLGDADDAVVEVAAFACGEHARPPAVVDALVRMAGSHPDHLCREAAVAALGSLGDPAGLDAVLAGCRDRHTVRRRAVLALAAFDDPRADAALAELAGDRDLQVRQAAAELLAISGGSEVGGSAGT